MNVPTWYGLRVEHFSGVSGSWSLMQELMCSALCQQGGQLSAQECALQVAVRLGRRSLGAACHQRWYCECEDMHLCSHRARSVGHRINISGIGIGSVLLVVVLVIMGRASHHIFVNKPNRIIKRERSSQTEERIKSLEGILRERDNLAWNQNFYFIYVNYDMCWQSYLHNLQSLQYKFWLSIIWLLTFNINNLKLT